MAKCLIHGQVYDPQWEWCIYCGPPKWKNETCGHIWIEDNNSTGMNQKCTKCGEIKNKVILNEISNSK